MRLALWSVASMLFCAIGGSGYETVEDAARIGRALVDASPDWVATMATVYPENHDLAGSAFPLQEYYAPCYANGSLTLLFLPISRHSQNILRSPSNAASIAVASSPARASRARISLIGNVTILPDDIDVETTDELKSCYLAKHPDAKWWLPGDEDGAHISHWARFDPHQIYFVGGFGGMHYIGYVPLDLYKSSGDAPAVTGLDHLPSEIVAGGRVPIAVAGRVLVNQQERA